MSDPSSRIFPAKLLLFGEYTVLCGSQALAVPLSGWKGEWQCDGQDGEEDGFIRSYLHWLREKHMISLHQEKQILQDFHTGWRYRSDIPIGYGMGSSGAFVAALYHRYLQEEGHTEETDVMPLLASMENFFHGSSSGMDPMVSYSRKAIYKDDRGQFRGCLDPGWPEGFRAYLLDSGQDRATGPLVQQFQYRLTSDAFAQMIYHQLIPMVDHAIHFYLNGSHAMLAECLALISMIQREHFSFLIPERVQEQWDQLMHSPGVMVKICGAGGGGFFLVIDTMGTLDPQNFSLMTIG